MWRKQRQFNWYIFENVAFPSGIQTNETHQKQNKNDSAPTQWNKLSEARKFEHTLAQNKWILQCVYVKRALLAVTNFHILKHIKWNVFYLLLKTILWSFVAHVLDTVFRFWVKQKHEMFWRGFSVARKKSSLFYIYVWSIWL